MERTGGMENAHETMAADWATVQARFLHRLGRLRTPPVRSTGKIVVLFEHDVTGGISNTRCEADGRKLTDERSLCSDEPFTFAGFRVHDPRIRRSTSPECAETVPPARPRAPRPRGRRRGPRTDQVLTPGDDTGPARAPAGVAGGAGLRLRRGGAANYSFTGLTRAVPGRYNPPSIRHSSEGNTGRPMELPTRPRTQRLHHVVAGHFEKFWRSKVIPAVELAFGFLVLTAARLGTTRTLLFVLLASVFPGPPTIHPTEDCSLAEAKRCLELRGLCNPLFQPPGLPSVTSNPLCYEERPRICRPCHDAFGEFEMNFVERLIYYGPFWLRYIIRVFSSDNEVASIAS